VNTDTKRGRMYRVGIRQVTKGADRERGPTSGGKKESSGSGGGISKAAEEELGQPLIWEKRGGRHYEGN